MRIFTYLARLGIGPIIIVIRTLFLVHGQHQRSAQYTRYQMKLMLYNIGVDANDMREEGQLQ